MILSSHSLSPSRALSAETWIDRDVVARELVDREELADLELDELEELGVVDHVGLVQGDHDVGHADLAGEQDVLARLRHRAVGGRHDQDRAVHLGGARDHVLDVVRVARAVHVRVVALVRLVLDVRGVDRDAALALLRSVVDGGEVAHLRVAVPLRQHLRDGSRQRRLAMVDVTDGADVEVRLGALELLLGHGLPVLPCLNSSAVSPSPSVARRETWELPRSGGTASCRWRAPGSWSARRSRSRTSRTGARGPR